VENPEFEATEAGPPAEAGPAPVAPIPPFEKAIFDALKFESHQVRKVDVSIGPRSRSVTFKFALTSEQVDQLNAMAG
jgi:hypothetical protein